MKLISHSSCGVKFMARVEKFLSVFSDSLDEGRLGVTRPEGQPGISEKMPPAPLISLEVISVPALAEPQESPPKEEHWGRRGTGNVSSGTKVSH